VKNLHRCHSHLEKHFFRNGNGKKGRNNNIPSSTSYCQKADLRVPHDHTTNHHWRGSRELARRGSERDHARHRRQGDKHWSRVPAARARDDPENVSSYPHLAGYRCTGRAPREKANIVMARFKHTVTTYLRSRSQVML